MDGHRYGIYLHEPQALPASRQAAGTPGRSAAVLSHTVTNRALIPNHMLWQDAGHCDGAASSTVGGSTFSTFQTSTLPSWAPAATRSPSRDTASE